MIKKVESGYKVKQTGKYKMKKETHIYGLLIYKQSGTFEQYDAFNK